MTFDATQGYVADQNESLGSPSDSGVTTGEGGGVLDVWYLKRRDKIRKLATSTFTNKSEFGVPAAVLDTSGYAASWDQTETFLGHSVQGQAIAPNGLGLEGTMKLLDGDTGEEMDGSVVNGTFIAKFAPIDGVIGGDESDVTIGSFDMEFEPTADGMGKTQTDVGYPNAAYFNVTYGYIAGTVEDRNGNPLPDEIVRGGGTSTPTNEDGRYALVAPDAVDVEATSLNGTTTKTPTAVGGETVNVDFTYGALEVRVTGPEGRPIKNAPVEIDGTNYRTNDAGIVLVDTAGLGEHNVSIMENIEETLTVLDEGQKAKTVYKGGARMEVRLFDGANGNEIKDVPAREIDTGTGSYSDSTGLVSVLSPVGSELQVRIAEGDPRYQTIQIDRQVEDGETISDEVTLERKTAITNS